jgi:hypothetical protein
VGESSRPLNLSNARTILPEDPPNETHRLGHLELRHHPQGAGDCHEILNQRAVDVPHTQCFHKPRAHLVASETTYNATDGTQR